MRSRLLRNIHESDWRAALGRRQRRGLERQGRWPARQGSSQRVQKVGAQQNAACAKEMSS